MDNKVVYLDNKLSSQIGFSRKRNVSSTKTESSDNETTKIISEAKKNTLKRLYIKFHEERDIRISHKTIISKGNIELIQIHFLTVFDNKLHKDFLNRYGLTPVEYLDFNKTILFQIENINLFDKFLSHIVSVIKSPENTNYQGQEFNLIALIYRFIFYSSADRLETSNIDGILLSFISTHLSKQYAYQKTILLETLNSHNIPFSYSDELPDILEIQNISTSLIRLIIDNFDIVKTITSSKTEKIRPSIAGPIREFGFTVNVPDNIPIVGIIDTGITKIQPFENILLNESYNHTELPSFWDEEGHGTLVAGLAALGDEFYTIKKETYDAKARILNIKALHKSNDNLNIQQLIKDIISANKNHGVRIFNMSLVIPQAKKYNSSYSQFAYELDRVAFQYDVLVFLSVGNFDGENLQLLKDDENHHPDHDYPAFFYKLKSKSDSHTCEDTNICSPSESLNNISVGALAGNFEFPDNSHATPSNLYPAYYSRKFHFDYDQKVNGTKIKQSNKFLNKPDFVMEGGDLFDYNSGMQILRSPTSNSEKFYGRTCGTSLATPLLTSYAAEILTRYPKIKTQSVKALLINSATFYSNKSLPHFKESKPHLLKSLIGYGRPVRDKFLGSDKNSIMYLIEGEIKHSQIMKYPINLPKYLLENGNKLHFDVSLAFSFYPEKDNHLSYLPIHISFCLVKNLNITEIAGLKESYGIKGEMGWSEDHFGIDNKLFSNTQKKTFKLQSKDIQNNKDSVAIAVRCLVKNDYIDFLKETVHDFSLVVRVTEIISNENNPDVDLYTEMMKINNYLEIDSIITQGELEADI